MKIKRKMILRKLKGKYLNDLCAKMSKSFDRVSSYAQFVHWCLDQLCAVGYCAECIGRCQDNRRSNMTRADRCHDDRHSITRCVW